MYLSHRPIKNITEFASQEEIIKLVVNGKVNVHIEEKLIKALKRGDK